VAERLDISTKHCTIEREGRVVILTMNRPEKRNALSPDMLAGLVLGYEYIDDDPEVRCAILTGAGGSFCSGMDLTSMGQQSEDPNVQAVMARGNNPHWKALLRDYRLSKPLIAAVEGYALAGGTELALATDLIVASKDASFGIPEVKRGLVAGGGGLLRLPLRIPPAIAMELALTGEAFTAERAHALGMVNVLAEPGGALDAAIELAERITANGPLAVAATKRIIVESRGWSPDAAFGEQNKILMPVFSSNDAKEGAIAFAEKRPARWTGT
jgi:enoyl-CoA hydratase